MRRNEKGFTLMELMVVIVIVAILAAVAVPLYINYVKDAQRTDAKAAIGAIITAEQSYFLKGQTGTPTFTNLIDDLVTGGVLDAAFKADVEKRWTITFPTGDADGYSVRAVSLSDPSVVVTYDYTKTGGGTWDAPTP
jgi:prepilin-type N-terminal cleavage/methylation domain-containing protein